MKTARYFDSIKNKPDRTHIKIGWIKSAIDNPDAMMTQSDGSIRIWAKVPEMNGLFYESYF